jgi:hypothetical protein
MENVENKEWIEKSKWDSNGNGMGKVRKLHVLLEKVPQKRMDEVRRGKTAWGKVMVPPQKMYDKTDEEYEFFLIGEKKEVVCFGEGKMLRF